MHPISGVMSAGPIAVGPYSTCYHWCSILSGGSLSCHLIHVNTARTASLIATVTSIATPATAAPPSARAQRRHAGTRLECAQRERTLHITRVARKARQWPWAVRVGGACGVHCAVHALSALLGTRLECTRGTLGWCALCCVCERRVLCGPWWDISV
jgi:hypothetical protein